MQKAVCVLTRIPIYGLLKDKVHMSMKALFAQRDFRETKILEDVYISSNQFNGQGALSLINDIRDQYIGLNLKQILHLPNNSVSFTRKFFLIF